MLLGYTREQALLFLTAAPIDCVSHRPDAYMAYALSQDSGCRT